MVSFYHTSVLLQALVCYETFWLYLATSIQLDFLAAYGSSPQNLLLSVIPFGKALVTLMDLCVYIYVEYYSVVSISLRGFSEPPRLSFWAQRRIYVVAQEPVGM